MSFESRLLDAERPFTSIATPKRTGAYRRGSEHDQPPPYHGRPPKPHRLWRWLRGSALWLSACTVEGLIAYGEAMYPGFYYPPRHDAGDAPRPARHGDNYNPASSGRAAKQDVLAGCRIVLTPTPRRRARTAGRLFRLAARWRREAAARRQAELLGTFSDHVLHDIGVPRDQIDGIVRHDFHRE